ncbi:MAG: hypothetical protein A2268_07965 [Candidatus Raymondbacteria bacterium RifOxyA12_full_50_37]|uniref:Uncharacterized protein n=1 Tax=Candidatus Raymondbacteria bacterium RIFOXYD12_FULL_49_13 TaxID=1817890 RepID=A0A1F7FJX0_UNCRA|nr:MAG: hypothetical protein A2350_13155 [Candidatus Raymondbacteria bacterium RifOxyB12_full_50_8]OGJ91743.1 MAG: hypothetical protein A2268_07965 [Candidatus Raymondbacteria bacterium RifOxyA12_full_50_37]OGJ93503.1 MAG: hypothetical protein A2248_09010 [Candidatus Raymondbacteria bacterium RIFOXYA2_FULL_49_16]OGJ98773.1 MAG: hypothetical protein A2453_09820 [Candidatus Raymondbacteria bacterium RIFOXYC2_FULL_50_21]OGK06933.1 MAG: hypothetical protein A2519_05815 [Candidatus Raymondbacteria b
MDVCSVCKNRDKSKDTRFFCIGHEQEMEYIAGLYPDKDRVRKFLETKRNVQWIGYAAYLKVYWMIKQELGYPIPG